jgi:hypothetical protein
VSGVAPTLVTETGVEMITRFDDEIQASWEQFEAQVGRALREIGDDSFCIELEGGTDESGAFPYVQFIGYDDMVRAEVAGNGVLDPAHQMDGDQQDALVAIGWQQPCDVESPNWWVDVTREQVEVILTMVTAAFRKVFGVVHPKFLVSERLSSSDAAEDDGSDGSTCTGSAPDADEDAEPVIGLPHDHDELVKLVCRALATVYGADLVRDGDGDFPISTGTVPIWVRAHREKPIVRIFSYVARSVRDVRQTRVEIGILNRRQDFLKFVLSDGIVTASFDLPAAPFVGPQLLWTIEQVAKQLDDLAADTAARVGGKLWFDESSKPQFHVDESA